MRASFALVIGAFALAACGEGEAARAPAGTNAPASVAEAVDTTGVALDVAGLRRVCRAGLAAIHGQQPSVIDVESVQGEVVHASWRAPVDGGRMKADCRVENDQIVWMPRDLPDQALVRWMNQSGDPVIRYALNGGTVTITQTLPDGTTERAEMAVPAEEEAR